MRTTTTTSTTTGCDPGVGACGCPAAPEESPCREDAGGPRCSDRLFGIASCCSSSVAATCGKGPSTCTDLVNSQTGSANYDFYAADVGKLNRLVGYACTRPRWERAAVKPALVSTGEAADGDDALNTYCTDVADWGEGENGAV